MTKEELQKIEAEYSAAARCLDEVSARRRDARVEMAQINLGIKIGDRVLYKDAYYVVSELMVHNFENWIRGFKVLKSGEVSTHTSLLYDYWKKI